MAREKLRNIRFDKIRFDKIRFDKTSFDKKFRQTECIIWCIFLFLFISLYNIEMNVVKQIKALCTPAYIYFSLSVISILAILGQNSLGHHTYAVGQRRVNLPHTNTVYFVVKIVGVLIWTYILQNLCKSGYKNIAWFLVLIPFFFLFFIVGAVLVYFADYKAEIKQMKYRAAYHPAMRRVPVRHPVMHHSTMRYPAMHHSAMHHSAMRRGLTHHPAMRRGAMPMHH